MRDRGAFPKITEEGLAELRSRIGTRRPLVRPAYTVASLDNLRRFCYGFGDDNPLWMDEEYAGKTRWGGIIAPPCFVRTMGGPHPQGLPGVHGSWVGERFEFFAPVRLGDRIDGATGLVALVEHRSEFAIRTYHEHESAEYFNQDGQLVARLTNTYIRYERDTASQKGKYSEIEPKTWTQEEREKLDEVYLQEERRGATPRYWEDVQTGEEIPPRLKGPLTVADVIWGYIGGGSLPFSRAFGLAAKMRQRHPGQFMVNTQGAFEAVPSCHWDWNFARRVGAPGPYDSTAQRINCLAQAVTDWIGDDGWVKKYEASSRRFNILGDIQWHKGKVVGKSVSNGEHIVQLDLRSENQRGDVCTIGSAEVLLPTKTQIGTVGRAGA